MATRVHTVSEISAHLRALLSSDPLSADVWIRGEVGNLARPGSGHVYFSLRDSGAALRCAMFKHSGHGADLLEAGAEVIAHGRISMYAPRGDLQLVVDLVQPEGVGEMQLRFEELRARLEREGLFDRARKREVPRFPRRVGVATSPSGSVWHDIRNVVARRYPLAELLIAPTPVQGEDAAAGIAEALAALDGLGDIDVIILARGGGSAEDLAAFNEEAVARAVFSCGVPVISGVGHETDVTISDWVADLRAPTPSAAAEMAVPDIAEIMAAVDAAVRNAEGAAAASVRATRRGLDSMWERIEGALPDADSMRMRIDELLRMSASLAGTMAGSAAVRVDALSARLRASSPSGTLARGYAIVQAGPGGAVVSDASELRAGDAASVTLARGRFDAEVVSVAGG